MRLVFLALALVVAFPAAGQINAERMRRALEADGVQLALNADIALARGNTEFLQLGVGGRADWKRAADLVFVVGEFDFSQADADVFVDEGYVHARYNHDYGPVVIYEVFGQLERNSQQLLDTRALLGTGVRLRLVDDERYGFALGTTPMFEYERLTEAAGEPDASVARWSNYVSGRAALSETASFTGVFYAQPRFGDFGDVRFLSQATLDVGVTRWLRLRVRGRLRHDSRPPAGVERTDISLSNGFVFLVPAP
ncbi:MAG: DUF481 domain-containing protein [Bacteroidota bacterium]